MAIGCDECGGGVANPKKGCKSEFHVSQGIDYRIDRRVDDIQGGDRAVEEAAAQIRREVKPIGQPSLIEVAIEFGRSGASAKVQMARETIVAALDTRELQLREQIATGGTVEVLREASVELIQCLAALSALHGTEDWELRTIAGLRAVPPYPESIMFVYDEDGDWRRVADADMVIDLRRSRIVKHRYGSTEDVELWWSQRAGAANSQDAPRAPAGASQIIEPKPRPA